MDLFSFIVSVGLITMLALALVQYQKEKQREKESREQGGNNWSTPDKGLIEKFSVSSKGLYCFFAPGPSEILIRSLGDDDLDTPTIGMQLLNSRQREYGPITSSQIERFCDAVIYSGTSQFLTPLYGATLFAGIIRSSPPRDLDKRLRAIRVDKAGYDELCRSENLKLIHIDGVVQWSSGECYPHEFYLRIGVDPHTCVDRERSFEQSASFYSSESDEFWATQKLVEIGKNLRWALAAQDQINDRYTQVESLMVSTRSNPLMSNARETIEYAFDQSRKVFAEINNIIEDLNTRSRHILEWINMPSEFKSSKNQIENIITIDYDCIDSVKYRYEQVLELTRLYEANRH